MAFVKDVTVPDDTQFDPGAEFVKTWEVSNTGSCSWNEGFVLKHVSGARMGAPPSVEVPLAKPGEQVSISVSMKAPNQAGLYIGEWKLCEGSECFDGLLTVRIVTKGPVGTGTPAPGACPYIGNKNSKIFHHASCSSVSRMSEKNKVCFATREEAIAAGYRPCKICKP